MLPVSLDCPFFIVHFVFSNVYSIKKNKSEKKMKTRFGR